MSKNTSLGSLINYLNVNAAGNITIATPSSGYALDVSGTGRFVTTSTVPLTAETTSGNSGVMIKTSSSTYNWLLGAQYTVGNGFEITPSTTVGGTTFTTPALVVKNTGYVGIGTTSPGAKLDVQSTGLIAKFLSTDNNLYTGYVANGTAVGYIGNGIGVINSGSATDFGFQASYNMAFATGGGTERVRITSGGNLLVASTTSVDPVFKFQVGDGTADTRVLFNSNNQYAISIRNGASSLWYIGVNAQTSTNGLQFYSNVGGALMTLTTGNNVGIGTTNPTNKLQVSGNIYSTDTVFGRNLKPEAWASVTAGTPSATGIPLGYSTININITTDNNWRSILSNINDVKGYFWVTLGDAASKDTAHYYMSLTSPGYGVSSFGVVNYQDNGWNTGSFEFTYDNVGGTHRLLVRCSSYYSGSGTAYGTIYFLRLE